MPSQLNPKRKLEWRCCEFVAALIGRLMEGQPEDLDRPEEREQGAVDLIFRVCETWFVVEHTVIESFPGQLDYLDGVVRSDLPASSDDIPERRQERMKTALDKKLPKLRRWKERLQQEKGDCLSILVLEDSDIQYSNAVVIAKAFEIAVDSYAANSRLVPDWVFLAESNWSSVKARIASELRLFSGWCLKDLDGITLEGPLDC